MSYPWECEDCVYLDTNDTKTIKHLGSYQTGFYCPKYRDYYAADSKSCSAYFKKKEVSNDCYLTTIMCHTLGYEDNCEILETLRNFRDNYMKPSEKNKPLLEDYDIIGPKICKKIEEDIIKENVAKIMLNFYIKPAINNIRENNNENAINIYKKMTLDLCEYYNINVEELNCSKENKESKVLKLEY